MHFCVRGTGRRLSEELLWDTQFTDKPSRRRFIISASFLVCEMYGTRRSTLSYYHSNELTLCISSPTSHFAVVQCGSTCMCVYVCV